MSKKKNKWEEMAKDDPACENANEAEEPKSDANEVGVESPGRDNVEDQLTACEKKADEAKEKMMLAYAELDNVRKRSERDVQNAHRYANEKILSELLPVVDSLVRATEGPEPQDEQAKSMREGVLLTIDLLEKTLAKFGVDPIAPEKGDAFDPEQHEAMSMVPDPECAANTIVQLLQKGYKLNDRVIRAAMVMVAS